MSYWLQSLLLLKWSNLHLWRRRSIHDDAVLDPKSLSKIDRSTKTLFRILRDCISLAQIDAGKERVVFRVHIERFILGITARM